MDLLNTVSVADPYDRRFLDTGSEMSSCAQAEQTNAVNRIAGRLWFPGIVVPGAAFVANKGICAGKPPPPATTLALTLPQPFSVVSHRVRPYRNQSHVGFQVGVYPVPTFAAGTVRQTPTLELSAPTTRRQHKMHISCQVCCSTPERQGDSGSSNSDLLQLPELGPESFLLHLCMAANSFFPVKCWVTRAG